MKPIDIFITTYFRQAYTERTIEYLYERTSYPFRLFVIDNGSNKDIIEAGIQAGRIFLGIYSSSNIGIHAAWNIALSLAESDFFITSDNDIYVPDLRKKTMNIVNGKLEVKDSQEKQPCWLERLVKLMERNEEYGAISLSPHILIGNVTPEINDPNDLIEVDHCGAVMRIMRREAVWVTGGWEHVVRTSRNHEERWICSKLHENGWLTGRCTRLRAYHPFGKDLGIGNWGYPEAITPEMQGHNPNLKEEVLRFDNIDAYDNATWLSK